MSEQISPEIQSLFPDHLHSHYEKMQFARTHLVELVANAHTDNEYSKRLAFQFTNRAQQEANLVINDPTVTTQDRNFYLWTSSLDSALRFGVDAENLDEFYPLKPSELVGATIDRLPAALDSRIAEDDTDELYERLHDAIKADFAKIKLANGIIG